MPIRERRDFSKHRKWLMSLPCCMTGLNGQTDPAHIRTGNGGGMGLKPHDKHCVPLRHSEHMKQHETSEEKYWGEHLDRAKKLALDLWEISGDDDKAYLLIGAFYYAVQSRQRN